MRYYDRLQAAEDGSINQHFADLHVDRETGQVVTQRGEEMTGQFTGTDLSQQVDGITDRLGQRRIKGPAQEVLRRTILTFLTRGEKMEAGEEGVGFFFITI